MSNVKNDKKKQSEKKSDVEKKKTNVSEGRVVKEGCTVKLHYRGTLDNGTIFDTSEGRMPLEFKVGAHHVICGFEEGVLGMAIGDEKEIICSPEHAYGDYNDQLIQVVPRAMFVNIEKQLEAENKKLQEGMLLGMQSPDGRIMHAKVLNVLHDTIKLDLNHILAGKTLHFKVKIEDIKEE